MAIDMAGESYGSLLVEARAGTTPCGSATWRCLCACGEHTVVSRRHLVTGEIISCGDRSQHPRYGGGSYGAAHQYIRKVKGSASARVCVGCGGQAQEWSFMGGSRGGFSWDPSDYAARCRPCHHDFDKEA